MQLTDSIPDGESPPAVNPLSARPRDTQPGAFLISGCAHRVQSALNSPRSPGAEQAEGVQGLSSEPSATRRFGGVADYTQSNWLDPPGTAC